MAERYITPVQSYFDDNGDPLAGARLYFYDNNTTNPKNTYSDVDLTTVNPNPVEADGAGRFTADIFLETSSYRVELRDSSDVVIWTKDDVNNVTGATASGATPNAGAVWAFFGTQTQLNVYLADGWFICDGNNGTPNLDESYIKGTTNVAGIGITGGNNLITPTGTVEDHTLTIDQIPAHDHDAEGSPNYTLVGRIVSGVGTPGGQPGTILQFADMAEIGGDQPHNHSLTMDQESNEPQYTQLVWLYYPGV